MWLRTFLLSTLILCLGFVHGFAKDYEIPEIRVEVTVKADGTGQITDLSQIICLWQLFLT